MGFNLCGWIPKPLHEALQKRLNLLVVQGLTALPKLGKENLFHKNCGIISVKVVKMIEKDVVKYEMKNKKYQAYQEPPSTLGPDRMSARDVAETCFRILLESSLVLTFRHNIPRCSFVCVRNHDGPDPCCVGALCHFRNPALKPNITAPFNLKMHKSNARWKTCFEPQKTVSAQVSKKYLLIFPAFSHWKGCGSTSVGQPDPSLGPCGTLGNILH